MTLAEMADYVCAKVGQTDGPSVEACKLFLRRRYQMVWDYSLWKETQFLAAITTNDVGVCVLPGSCDQVIAVRDQRYNIRPFERANVAVSFPDALLDPSNPGFGFIFLSPACLPIMGEQVVIVEGINTISSTSLTFTLATSGLYTGSDLTGLHGGTASTADFFKIYSPDLVTVDVYFYSLSGAPGVGWRKTGGGATDYSGLSVPPGTLIVIERVVSDSFTWAMPDDDDNNGKFRVHAYSDDVDDSTQTMLVTGEGCAGQTISEEVALTSTVAAGTFNFFTNVSSLTLSSATEGNLFVYGISGVFMKPGQLAITPSPRIQVLGVTDERPLSALCKRIFNDLTNDIDTPQLRNCQNALLAFAQADMLERQRQYSKSKLLKAEGASQLQVMLDLEKNQSASDIRIVPDDSMGESPAYGCEWWGYSKGYW